MLNADANLVVFRSVASELVADDFNATQDIFACPFTPEEVVINPHPEFACEAVVNSDGVTELSWNTEPGRAYRVQVTDDLGAATWNDLSRTVILVGSRASLSDPTATAAAQRFYRVVLVE